jgi:hypothetical protein
MSLARTFSKAFINNSLSPADPRRSDDLRQSAVSFDLGHDQW